VKVRHRRKGRRLGRTTSHRLALLRNLATALFVHERIRTTEPRCKELRRYVEKLITKAKRGDVHARQMVSRDIKDRKVLSKLFDVLAPRYAERPGGYTRIVKLGPRKGDCAAMSIIELVDNEIEFEE
jgi:large subunit ribosomal protein L17